MSTPTIFSWLCSFTLFSVKHKDTEDKMEDIRKRHLNVVFIGHVGRLIRFGVVVIIYGAA